MFFQFAFTEIFLANKTVFANRFCLPVYCGNNVFLFLIIKEKLMKLTQYRIIKIPKNNSDEGHVLFIKKNIYF